MWMVPLARQVGPLFTLIGQIFMLRRFAPASWCAELLVPYVIHAVGPKYARYAEKHKEEEADVKLANAYTASLARAQEVGIEAIAFSLISAGAYRGQKRTLHDIVEIVLTTLCSMRYEGLKEIHVCGFNENEYLTLIEVAHKLKLVRVCNDPTYQEFMTLRG